MRPAPAARAAGAAASPAPAPPPRAACRSPRTASCASRRARGRAAARRRGAAIPPLSSPASRAPRSTGRARSTSPPSRLPRRDYALHALRVAVGPAVAQPTALEQRDHLGHLRRIALLRVGAAGPEPLGHLGDQAPDDVQAIRAAEERDVRLGLAGLLGQRGAIGNPGRAA